jgi:hypothetical protein
MNLRARIERAERMLPRSPPPPGPDGIDRELVAVFRALGTAFVGRTIDGFESEAMRACAEAQAVAAFPDWPEPARLPKGGWSS